MVKKSKGRQKIEMVKMKNESNLQVTFSKRRSGLFKKASELCTLCAAEIVIIVFSPGGKVFSFGHPNAETVIDQFLNNNPPLPHHRYNMHLNEVHHDSIIQELNSQLTQSENQFNLEKKRNKDIKKIRGETKALGHWWENPIETLDLVHLYAFKTHLENVKKIVTLEASKYFQATIPNFYVGSPSNAAFGIDGDTHINHNFDISNQRRMIDVNAFDFNLNQIPHNHPFPFGNNPHGSISQGFLPEYIMNYRLDFNLNQNHNQNQYQNQNHNHNQYQNQNQNQNQSFKREDFS